MRRIKPLILTLPAARRAALVCLLLLFIYETYVIGTDYSGYLAYMLDSETGLMSVVTCVCLFVSIGLFYQFLLFAMSTTWPYKVCCFGIFVGSVLVEYGYQK